MDQQCLLTSEELGKLRSHYVYLSDNLDIDIAQGLVDLMYERRLLQYSHLEKFNEIQFSNKKVQYVLNSILIKGDSDRYRLFVDYLKDHHPSLHELMVLSASPVHDCPANPPGLDGIDEQTFDSEPECLKMVETLSPEMTVTVLPSLTDDIRRKAYKNRSVYRMSNPVRGTALLFFNTRFADPNLPSRYGAEHDMKNLSNLFYELNFNVRVHLNTTRREMIAEFDKQRFDDIHSNYGCFVMGFSTHGSENSLSCSDGKSIYLDEIYEYFDSTHFPYMAGKPKFFFFDASSGHQVDKGLPLQKDIKPSPVVAPTNTFSEISVSISDIGMSLVAPVQVAGHTSLQPLDIARRKSSTIPERSDFLLAFATCEGYVSWRRNSHGCWFSRVLVEVFQKHACDEHVVQLLKRIRRKLCYVATSHGYKQVNLTVDTLLKDFYLFPGMDV